MPGTPGSRRLRRRHPLPTRADMGRRLHCRWPMRSTRTAPRLSMTVVSFFSMKKLTCWNSSGSRQYNTSDNRDFCFCVGLGGYDFGGRVSSLSWLVCVFWCGLIPLVLARWNFEKNPESSLRLCAARLQQAIVTQGRLRVPRDCGDEPQNARLSAGAHQPAAEQSFADESAPF